MDFYEIIEKARKTGKIDKGTNEVTKAVERGVAKLIVYAEDVQPREIVQHLPMLCKEKGIPCVSVDSKQKLGIAAGINVATASIAVIQPGEAATAISELASKAVREEKEEKVTETKKTKEATKEKAEEKKPEEKKEVKAAEKKEKKTEKKESKPEEKKPEKAKKE